MSDMNEELQVWLEKRVTESTPATTTADAFAAAVNAVLNEGETE